MPNRTCIVNGVTVHLPPDPPPPSGEPITTARAVQRADGLWVTRIYDGHHNIVDEYFDREQAAARDEAEARKAKPKARAPGFANSDLETVLAGGSGTIGGVTVGSHLANGAAPRADAGLSEELAIRALFEGVASLEETP